MANMALGKSHREGLTIVEFMRMFPDGDAAERWFVEQRWPDGPFCPKCGSFNVVERKSRRPQPYRCRGCRKYFSVKTGTVMHSSNLGFQTWSLAGYLLMTNLKGVSAMKLRRDLGVTYKTARCLAHRIRETWERETGRFTGFVEADETYVGGKKKKGTPGRGPVGKAIVAGVKERGTKRVRAEVIENIRKGTIHGFVRENVEPGSAIYTDEMASYRGIPNPHEAVNRTVGEWVRGMAHTQGIESFWSMLKRAYDGTYHWMSPKHLQRYVNGFSGRHNDRDLDTTVQLGVMVQGMVEKKLTCRELVR